MPRRKRKMKLPSRRNGTLVPDDEDSDSDLQEFSLPKKRIIKPGKSTYVARRRCGCCRVCASVFLSVLLIASVLCVVVLGWFSLRFKRDLDFMRRRLSKVESFDRSTSREYESLNNDLTQKYESLKASKEKAIKQDDEQYKSILKQIAHLNTTVDQLQKKMKLPESASTITQDIDSLKKGMADTGGDITEIKDKIKQLTSLASQQNGKVEDLSKKVFNLSVQVAHVMGKPTPKTPKNTGTPPLILRMPVSDDGEQETEDQSFMKNVTAQISVEVGRVMGIVTSVNHTLSHDVSKLQVLMKSLVAEVKKHVTTLDELQTKVSQNLKPNHSSVVSRGHLEADSEGVSEQVFNLSLAVTKLSDDVEQHSKNLAELMLEVVQINTTVFKYQHQDAILEKPAQCNCSAEVGKVWEQLSSNKLSIESVQKELQALQKPVAVQPTNASAVVTTEASISDDKKNTENQSSAESIASETDKDIEQDELEAENIKPSPTPESNTSVSVVEVVKVTEPPVTAPPSGNDNSTLHSTQTSNTTASPQVALVNSTNNNQTSSSDQKVEVIKLATPSSEEEVEKKLEAPGSD